MYTLLVVDDRERVVGPVTARDLQGERPMQIIRGSGVTRGEIRAADMMVPQAAIEVFTMASVVNARAGHVLHTLHAFERQHGLAVEEDERDRQRIRGMFSTSEVAKRTGKPAEEPIASAPTLAELQEVRASGV